MKESFMDKGGKNPGPPKDAERPPPPPPLSQDASGLPCYIIREKLLQKALKALEPFAKAAKKIPDFGPHAKAVEDILAVNYNGGSLPMFGTDFHRARMVFEEPMNTHLKGERND